MIITIGRKPFTGTVSTNTKQQGCGGINIEACRISSTESLARPYNEANNQVYGTFSKLGNPVEPSGRFPANVFLSHSPECRVVGSKKQRSKQLTAGNRTVKWGIQEGGCSYEKGTGAKFATEEGWETVPKWSCSSTCSAVVCDEQSGEIKSPKSYVRGADGFNNGVFTDKPSIGQKAGTFSLNFGDGGGASKFFKVLGGNDDYHDK